MAMTFVEPSSSSLVAQEVLQGKDQIRRLIAGARCLAAAFKSFPGVCFGYWMLGGRSKQAQNGGYMRLS